MISGSALIPDQVAVQPGVGIWRGKERVVVALESEPDDLNPVSPDGESATIILAAMLHGAFSASPAFEFSPVPSSGAEAIVGDEQL